MPLPGGRGSGGGSKLLDEFLGLFVLREAAFEIFEFRPVHAAATVAAPADAQEFVKQFVVHQVIQNEQRNRRRIEDPTDDQPVIALLVTSQYPPRAHGTPA